MLKKINRVRKKALRRKKKDKTKGLIKVVIIALMMISEKSTIS